MRALVFDEKLEYRSDYPAPSHGDDEALIKISHAGICATDIEITKGYMGFKGALGHEFSGVIEDCVKTELWGRRVTGEINISCGRCEYCLKKMRNHCPERKVLGILGKDGAFAEYITLPLRNLQPLPDSITDEEAVFVEPLSAAFEVLEQVRIDDSKRVCILGDGKMGLLVAEVIYHAGYMPVVLGRHPEKMALLKGRGMDTRTGTEGMGREFDIVVDCTGSGSGFAAALKIVKPCGTIVMKTTVANGQASLNQVVIDEITVIGSRCGPFKPAVEALGKRSIDVRPFISKVYSLEDGMEAMDYARRPDVLKVILKAG